MERFFIVLILLSIYGCGNKENTGNFSKEKADSLQTVYKLVAENHKEQVTFDKQGNFLYPRFSSNGSQIYFTSSGQKGIYAFDRDSKQLKTITDDQGAGYNFIILQNGTQIVYRRDSFSSRRRKSEIVLVNSEGGSSKIIFNEALNLSYPIKANENIFAFTAGNQLKIYDVTQSKFIEPSSVQDTLLYIDGDAYSLLLNGEKRSFAPFGKGSYLWASLSPDNNAVLFNYMGEGTFISDLEGKIKAEFAYAGYPQWSPDGNWITYMTEESDGHTITRAEIFVSSSDGKTTFQITSTEDITELYPSWSADGKSLVYCTDKGEIFISQLSFEK